MTLGSTRLLQIDHCAGRHQLTVEHRSVPLSAYKQFEASASLRPRRISSEIAFVPLEGDPVDNWVLDDTDHDRAAFPAHNHICKQSCGE